MSLVYVVVWVYRGLSRVPGPQLLPKSTQFSATTSINYLSAASYLAAEIIHKPLRLLFKIKPSPTSSQSYHQVSEKVYRYDALKMFSLRGNSHSSGSSGGKKDKSGNKGNNGGGSNSGKGNTGGGSGKGGSSSGGSKKVKEPDWREQARRKEEEP
ncbi:hypothetical protein F4777DRAFT_582575 [Nemania sp. FL0916]|nr:hypothetical protein F4777DRAFT_582575 [Nemania sp. FL0916]